MSLVFITGGVRSGKSAYAERYVHRLGQIRNAGRYVYLATGVATDNEMLKRIERHRIDRLVSEKRWHTVEAPYTIPDALRNLQLNDIVLWDCATTWLTNCFYEGYDTGTPCVTMQGCVSKKIEQMKEALKEVLHRGIAIVVVSNEVLDDLPYTDDESKYYRQCLGELNQWFVAHAKEAYELDYGIVKKWK